MSTPSESPAPIASPSGMTPSGVPKPRRDAQTRALEGIRQFLQSKSCYDILPESFRLIVFDNKLSITRSLQALVTNGKITAPRCCVVSAPLYDSTTQRFAGMFTLADVVHLIQYYYLTSHEYANVVAEVEAFQLGSLRKIEQAIDVPPPPTISVHPDQPLSDACAALVRTHARRLPLVDRDDQTGKETIVSVLTQYRVLKFIAINCQHDCARMEQSIGALGIGSYCSWYQPSSALSSDLSSVTPLSPAPSTSKLMSPIDGVSLLPSDKVKNLSSAQLDRDNAEATTPHGDNAATTTAETHPASGPGDDVPASNAEFGVRPTDRYFPLSTATLKTSVFDVVHIFSERGISAVPIIDEDGIVLNMYETVDIVDLVRQNAYEVLDSTIEVALDQRSADFTGVMTCSPRDSLASILAYIRERRCHRFVILEPDGVPPQGGRPGRKKGSLIGILSLSDVLRYLVGQENLKGMEVPGLGLHGLRGVGNVPPEEIDVLDDGVSLRSKPGSRRGSGATDAGSSGIPSAADIIASQVEPGPAAIAGANLGLEDVVEDEVLKAAAER
ncbi:BZ3500_MvSof-1268-A1-R1_Chr1-1g01029 [Microbotryum saponariae]|uniref:BZ3500_MvSof-1268-A1-R1_Chr1-1g01029 protein n=1 Tax=Microbotryum saponariae TaxID=289078 RepID=A0A2X0KAF7_9BASI|nr:BZ3500_MvSof-1268-A1-R1_Chr1-1g01029 [Microbotryum saponariae]SCZ93224.1 BZ3501_MvSof-1269-A2-R1_Chr1-1g00626 [Microbotryum saponariae]